MGKHQMPIVGLHMPVNTHSWALTCMYVPIHTHAKFKLTRKKNNQVENNRGRHSVPTSGLHTCMHGYAHLYTCVHTRVIQYSKLLKNALIEKLSPLYNLLPKAMTLLILLRGAF